MSNTQFVHCNVHTAFSLFDSTIRIKELVAQALAFQMPALAITDNGGMDGVPEFFKQCRDSYLKALIGCKMYLAPAGGTESQGRCPMRLTLLAKDLTGYRNLCQLVSASHRQKKPHQAPYVDPALLEDHSQGLIALSAGIQGEIADMLLQGDESGARTVACWYKERFDFYLELQNHGTDQEKTLNRQLVRLARVLEIPLLASNNVHYLHQSDEPLLQTLRRLGHAKYESQAHDFHYPGGPEYYLKSSVEMSQLFQEVPEALRNSLEIAEKCSEFELEPDLGKRLPYDVKPGSTPSSTLRELAWKGLERKYAELTPEIRDRLESELEKIEEKEHSACYLLVADLMAWVRHKGIVIGPGRASAPGSLVSYALGMTAIDPIRFQLHIGSYFNRYDAWPTFQLEIPASAQGELLSYLGQRYGTDKVALITQHRRLYPWELLGDLARLRGFAEEKIQRLSGLVPHQPGATVSDALEAGSVLRNEMDSQAKVQDLVYDAQRLEYLAAGRDVHCCALVISPEPLARLVPLRFEKDQPITQYTQREIDSLDLFQLHLLPVDELEVLSDVQKLLESRDIYLDLANIPLEDPAAFALIHAGNTESIFWLDGQNKRQKWAMKFKPDSLEELADMVTLAFQRTKDLGLGVTYLSRKEGHEEIPSFGKVLDPVVQPILGKTKGLILYKDQILSLAETVAGFTHDEAVELIKRSRTSFQNFTPHLKAFFLAGAAQRQISAESAERLFEQMQKQGAASMNKGHLLGLTLMIYCSAWVKAHYPVEWERAVNLPDRFVYDTIDSIINI